MVLLRFFFKKTIQDIEEKIHTSFDNIKEDMGSVASWIHHFKQRHEATETEISNIKAELEALKGQVTRQSAKKAQLRTHPGRIRGHIHDASEDMSFVKKHVKKSIKPEIFDKSLMAKSHLELLTLLYHSDRILSYEELSKRLNKTRKSIRNIIYEMRKKGVDISDKAISSKEKGFYLTKEVKIKVSGR